MVNVIAIGDSLTNYGFQKDGWATLIQKAYPTIHIQNFGENGISSSEMVKQLPSFVDENAIRYANLATIWLGTNDVLRYYEQTISFQQYYHNIVTIIHYLKYINPSLQVILIGVPVSKFSVNQFISKEESFSYKFNSQLLNLSKHYHLPFVNLMDNCDGNEILLEDLYDGIHMNETGQKKTFFKIINVLKHFVQ